ncbi:MAG TPA: FAD-dependent monooxygenase [Burkholderiales bacterium]|nr:FAD-dependent monooxygenase [Burkholderiales bacterium]
MPEAVPVAIVGGGPVGAALAIGLTGGGIDAVVLEARSGDTAVADPRPLALSYGSRLILERLEVWGALGPVTPIEEVHVSQRGGFGRVVMTAARAGLPALGYVIEYARLQSVLRRTLAERRVRTLHGVKVSAVRPEQDVTTVEYENAEGQGAVAARMVVVADGGTLRSEAARVSDYRQSAVVAMVKSELPHRNVAFERFTARGPIALLPHREELALIWSLETNTAQAWCAEPADVFLARLHCEFGARLGGFTSVGTRTSFPLSLKLGLASTPRTLYIGNASQTLHPVAGQGLNLGLRDAWELAGEVRDADAATIGGAAMLDAFQNRRRIDRRGGVGFTDGLVRVFSNDVTPLRLARGLGLTLLDAFPPAKDFLVRRMTFGARG